MPSTHPTRRGPASLLQCSLFTLLHCFLLLGTGAPFVRAFRTINVGASATPSDDLYIVPCGNLVGGAALTNITTSVSIRDCTITTSDVQAITATAVPSGLSLTFDNITIRATFTPSYSGTPAAVEVTTSFGNEAALVFSRTNVSVSSAQRDTNAIRFSPRLTIGHGARVMVSNQSHIDVDSSARHAGGVSFGSDLTIGDRFTLNVLGGSSVTVGTAASAAAVAFDGNSTIGDDASVRIGEGSTLKAEGASSVTALLLGPTLTFGHRASIAVERATLTALSNGDTAVGIALANTTFESNATLRVASSTVVSDASGHTGTALHLMASVVFCAGAAICIEDSALTGTAVTQRSGAAISASIDLGALSAFTVDRSTLIGRSDGRGGAAVDFSHSTLRGLVAVRCSTVTFRARTNGVGANPSGAVVFSHMARFVGVSMVIEDSAVRIPSSADTTAVFVGLPSSIASASSLLLSNVSLQGLASRLPVNVSSGATAVEMGTTLCLHLVALNGHVVMDAPAEFVQTCRAVVNVSHHLFLRGGLSVSPLVLACDSVKRGVTLVDVTSSVLVQRCRIDSVNEAAVTIPGGIQQSGAVVTFEHTVISVQLSNAASPSNDFIPGVLLRGECAADTGLVFRNSTVAVTATRALVMNVFLSGVAPGPRFHLLVIASRFSTRCEYNCHGIRVAGNATRPFGDTSRIEITDSSVSAEAGSGSTAVALYVEKVPFGPHGSLRVLNSTLRSEGYGSTVGCRLDLTAAESFSFVISNSSVITEAVVSSYTLNIPDTTAFGADSTFSIVDSTIKAVSRGQSAFAVYFNSAVVAANFRFVVDRSTVTGAAGSHNARALRLRLVLPQPNASLLILDSTITTTGQYIAALELPSSPMYDGRVVVRGSRLHFTAAAPRIELTAGAIVASAGAAFHSTAMVIEATTLSALHSDASSHGRFLVWPSVVSGTSPQTLRDVFLEGSVNVSSFFNVSTAGLGQDGDGLSISRWSPLCVDNVTSDHRSISNVTFPPEFVRSCQAFIDVSKEAANDRGTSPLVIPCDRVASGVRLLNITANVTISNCTVRSRNQAAVFISGGVVGGVALLFEDLDIVALFDRSSTSSAALGTNASALSMDGPVVGDGVTVTVTRSSVLINATEGGDVAASALSFTSLGFGSKTTIAIERCVVRCDSDSQCSGLRFSDAVAADAAVAISDSRVTAASASSVSVRFDATTWRGAVTVSRSRLEFQGTADESGALHGDSLQPCTFDAVVVTVEDSALMCLNGRDTPRYVAWPRTIIGDSPQVIRNVRVSRTNNSNVSFSLPSMGEGSAPPVVGPLVHLCFENVTMDRGMFVRVVSPPVGVMLRSCQRFINVTAEAAAAAIDQANSLPSSSSAGAFVQKETELSTVDIPCDGIKNGVRLFAVAANVVIGRCAINTSTEPGVQVEGGLGTNVSVIIVGCVLTASEAHSAVLFSAAAHADSSAIVIEGSSITLEPSAAAATTCGAVVLSPGTTAGVGFVFNIAASAVTVGGRSLCPGVVVSSAFFARALVSLSNGSSVAVASLPEASSVVGVSVSRCSFGLNSALFVENATIAALGDAAVVGVELKDSIFSRGSGVAVRDSRVTVNSSSAGSTAVSVRAFFAERNGFLIERCSISAASARPFAFGVHFAHGTVFGHDTLLQLSGSNVTATSSQDGASALTLSVQGSLGSRLSIRGCDFRAQATRSSAVTLWAHAFRWRGQFTIDTSTLLFRAALPAVPPMAHNAVIAWVLGSRFDVVQTLIEGSTLGAERGTTQAANGTFVVWPADIYGDSPQVLRNVLLSAPAPLGFMVEPGGNVSAATLCFDVVRLRTPRGQTVAFDEGPPQITRIECGSTLSWSSTSTQSFHTLTHSSVATTLSMGTTRTVTSTSRPNVTPSLLASSSRSVPTTRSLTLEATQTTWQPPGTQRPAAVPAAAREAANVASGVASVGGVVSPLTAVVAVRGAVMARANDCSDPEPPMLPWPTLAAPLAWLFDAALWGPVGPDVAAVIGNGLVLLLPLAVMLAVGEALHVLMGRSVVEAAELVLRFGSDVLVTITVALLAPSTGAAVAILAVAARHRSDLPVSGSVVAFGAVALIFIAMLAAAAVGVVVWGWRSVVDVSASCQPCASDPRHSGVLHDSMNSHLGCLDEGALTQIMDRPDARPTSSQDGSNLSAQAQCAPEVARTAAPAQQSLLSRWKRITASEAVRLALGSGQWQPWAHLAGVGRLAFLLWAALVGDGRVPTSPRSVSSVPHPLRLLWRYGGWWMAVAELLVSVLHGTAAGLARAGHCTAGPWLAVVTQVVYVAVLLTVPLAPAALWAVLVFVQGFQLAALVLGFFDVGSASAVSDAAEGIDVALPFIMLVVPVIVAAARVLRYRAARARHRRTPPAAGLAVDDRCPLPERDLLEELMPVHERNATPDPLLGDEHARSSFPSLEDLLPQTPADLELDGATDGWAADDSFIHGLLSFGATQDGLRDESNAVEAQRRVPPAMEPFDCTMNTEHAEEGGVQERDEEGANPVGRLRRPPRDPYLVETMERTGLEDYRVLPS